VEGPGQGIKTQLDFRRSYPHYGVFRVAEGERFQGQDVQPESGYLVVHGDNDARSDLFYGSI
jgi:hypothetical protein